LPAIESGTDKSVTVAGVVLNRVKDQAIMQLEFLVNCEKEFETFTISTPRAPLRQSLCVPYAFEFLNDRVKDFVINFDFDCFRNERYAEFTALVMAPRVILNLADLRLPVEQPTQRYFAEAKPFSDIGIADNLTFILPVKRILIAFAVRRLVIDNAERSILPLEDFIGRSIKRDSTFVNIAEFAPMFREVSTSYTVTKRAELLGKTPVRIKVVTDYGFLGLLGITENGGTKVIKRRMKLQIQEVFHAFWTVSREAEASEIARRYCRDRFQNVISNQYCWCEYVSSWCGTKATGRAVKAERNGYL
jgi:hypothetical protein